MLQLCKFLLFLLVVSCSVYLLFIDSGMILFQVFFLDIVCNYSLFSPIKIETNKFILPSTVLAFEKYLI